MLTATSLLETLRETTRDHHARMEEVIDITRWLNRPADYAHLLARYLGIMEPIEDGLPHWQQLAAMGYRAQERRKTPALRLDLADLGVKGDEIAALPRCLANPKLETLGDVVGCLYVLECATLGGHAIAGIVKSRAPKFPLRFFNVYGNATRDRWMDFLRSLHSFERVWDDAEDAIRGAIRTFQAFEEWMHTSRVQRVL